MTQQKISYTEKEAASTQTPGELLTQELAAYYADPLGFVIIAYPWKQPGTELEHEQGPDENQKQFLIDLGKEVAGRAFNGTDPVMPILMTETSPPRVRSTNPERGKQLTYAEFAARHGGDFSNALSLMGLSMPSFAGMVSLARMATPAPLSPLPPVMQELKRTSLFRLLTAAGRENCPDAYLLDVYLDAPDGYTNSGGRVRKATRNTGATSKCIQLLRHVD